LTVNRPRLIEILRRCDARGWTLSELARRSHVQRNTLSAIVNGRTTPQRRTVEKLADVLGTTPEALVHRDEPLPGKPKRESDLELLVRMWRDLDPVGREIVLGFAAGMAANADINMAVVAARAAEMVARGRRAAEDKAAATPDRRARTG
jgi:transcriptional regulator with XRE-family HTH domain